MKPLCASFACLLLVVTQVFAIKGGPDYGGSSSMVGTYAGVLQPVFDPTNPVSTNSIGVFSLGVPSTGLSGGQFFMFTQGRVFSGSIIGVGQPSGGNIQAILNASFNHFVRFSDGSVSFVTASVHGNLKATAKSSSGFANSSVLLNGGATLYVDQGQLNSDLEPIFTEVLSLKVSGFRQSDTAPTVTITEPTAAPVPSSSPTATATPSG